MLGVARSLSARGARWLLPLAGLAVLCGCGGGGTLAVATSASATSSAPTWTPGVFQPPAQFAALCASPRTGTDPYTGEPYPDRQGTTLDENNWLRSWTHQLYLWYDEVQDVNPALYTTPEYFQLMKTMATTPSGAPQDRFHYTYPTSVWEELSQSGVNVGYGVQWEIVAATPPRSVAVAYLEPAANLPPPTVAANLVRGDAVLAVDGVDINATDQTSINTINEGLSPASVGETHTFEVLDPGASTPRTVQLQAANITSIPVLLETTLTGDDGGTVGYILYNEQVATAESELINAINDLKSKGVTDVVLDLRYDGGGYLDIASELAYMIAGPNQTAGETFELQQFNNQYPTTNPVTGEPITPTLFHDTTQGFSVTAGQPLPTLDLTRVAVITGQDTCSASESIINGLQGVGFTVYQIGSTTCGKPYGFYPQDNCGTTYFSIEFQGVNAQGFGDYPDGFSPANTTPSVGALVPGCSVADDFSHALGDPSERRLAAALAYLANPQPSTCPSPPTGNATPATLSQRELLERIFVRSPLSDMRILRR
jgi:carboxyl-terminal processing protease